MRNKFITLFYINIIIVLIFLISCEKNSELKQPTPDNNLKIADKIPSGVRVVNGILRFDNEDIAHATFLTLDQLNSEYLDKLHDDCETQSDYEDKVDRQGFDEETILKLFEQEFGHKTMRSKIRTEEERWLNSKSLNFDTRPGFIIHDPVIQSLLNDEGEYMIGDNIYKIDGNGVTYGIEKSDFNALDELRTILSMKKELKYSKQACSSNIFVAQDNGLCAIIKLPNTTKNSEQYEKIDEEDLKSNTDVSDKRDFDNNNRYLFGRATITNVVGVSHYVKCTAESFKYKRGDNWKKYSVKQYAQVGARVYAKNNGSWEYWRTIDDASEYKGQRTATAKVSTYPTPIRVASGGLVGGVQSAEQSFFQFTKTF